MKTTTKLILTAATIGAFSAAAAYADTLGGCELIDKGGYSNLADPDCAPNEAGGSDIVRVPVVAPPTDPEGPPVDEEPPIEEPPIDEPPADEPPVDKPTPEPCDGDCGEGDEDDVETETGEKGATDH